MTTTETTHLKTKVAKQAKIIDYLLGLLQTRRTPVPAGIGDRPLTYPPHVHRFDPREHRDPEQRLPAGLHRSAGIRGPSAGSVFMRGSAAAVALAILAYTPSALAWAIPAKGMPAPLPMALFALILIATMAALLAFMAWQGAQIVREHGRKRRAASK
jgi:hypothetical protein